MKKTSIIILLITIVALLFPLNMKANSFETFGEELDYLEELRAEKRKQESDKALTEAEYERTTNEIYQTRKDIERLNDEIRQAEEDIKQLDKDIETKKNQTDSVLRFLQLSNGEKAYLEYIFKAKSFTDFIHRISIVEQISKDNKEKIQDMNDLIAKNNKLKKDNADNIISQQKKQKELNSKLNSLGNKISDLDGEGADLNEQINAQVEWVNQLKEMGCTKRSDKLATCMGMPTATGFVRPLGYGRVTSEYYWRKSPITGKQEIHSGIDIGGNKEGTEVYPVAAGVVGAKIYRSSCGGNMLYIYHVVNGKKYTSVYMHLLNFNEKFKVGDVVRLTDVVGYVGGGSTRVSQGGYDRCSTAAHLHLTLATGHTTAHRATMFNPRDMIGFPPVGSRIYWNSRSW